MAEYIVIYRNVWNQKVGIVQHDNEDDSAAVFDSEQDALEAASIVPILRACSYQVVELDV